MVHENTPVWISDLAGLSEGAAVVTYAFYYKDVLLGYLEIREGKHRYTPITENVRRVEREVPLIREVIRGYDWGTPIPFFQERIRNAARFGKEKCIRYHTDLFTMIMV